MFYQSVKIFLLIYINQCNSDVILTKPELINSKEFPGSIVLGMMIINIKGENTISRKFQDDIYYLMESILSWSSGTPLHLIVITDKKVVTGGYNYHFSLLSGQIFSWIKVICRKNCPNTKVFLETMPFSQFDKPFHVSLS